MKKSTQTDSTTILYDAQLIRIDEVSGILEFAAGGDIHTVRCSRSIWWAVGTIGCLRLGEGPKQFLFHAYPDQRLLRVPDADDPVRNRLGWSPTSLNDCRLTPASMALPNK
jgi:hypothetical protein